ncbi:hypothetical protein SASPL_117964 [Salvia splendens]|uniref:DUF7705 domain-containing protein n=1 Tax=Salvia splendens TaxID=180675 RepID=A0A8X8ZWT5_SALSN|nr:hypothetical protein SASPL_117964 [Salvia splendens]
MLHIIAMVVALLMTSVGGQSEYESAVGDPGMKRDGLRVAIEAWNQCNEVHEEAPNMGSPRQADCFDLARPSQSQYKLTHKVRRKENKLGVKQATIDGMEIIDCNKFAAWKELLLAEKCKVRDHPRPWHFWMVMLKSGNMDSEAAICPKDGTKSSPFAPRASLPVLRGGVHEHALHPPPLHAPRWEEEPDDAHERRLFRDVGLGCGHGHGCLCDAYSNPQPQEILQILPHPVWGEYGYPTKKGEGWIGDSRTWELDVGRLSHSLYFYQDPGTEPVVRHWPSVDVGTEIYVSGNEIAKWSLSNFDILVPK